MNEITINVEGMMCEGCENRVKNVLSQINGVTKVTASHKTGKVVITSNNVLDMKEIKETIDDIGYSVKE